LEIKSSLFGFFVSVCHLTATLGFATPACRGASDFETKTFENVVQEKRYIRVRSWPHIACLDLMSIRLTSIPPIINRCTELKSLDVREPFLQSLPPELLQYMKLETILSSGNPLAYPSQIQAMTELR
jgi:hypothetical protein